MTPEEIVGEFPQLTIADMHAALMYYHDNRELLGRQDRQARELVDQLTSAYPSRLGPRFGKDGPEIRYHLDESVRTAIAVGLRSHGVDVTTTGESAKLQPGRVLAIVIEREQE